MNKRFLMLWLFLCGISRAVLANFPQNCPTISQIDQCRCAIEKQIKNNETTSRMTLSEVRACCEAITMSAIANKKELIGLLNRDYPLSCSLRR